jgi:hypothetical protein
MLTFVPFPAEKKGDLEGPSQQRRQSFESPNTALMKTETRALCIAKARRTRPMATLRDSLDQNQSLISLARVDTSAEITPGPLSTWHENATTNRSRRFHNPSLIQCAAYRSTQIMPIPRNKARKQKPRPFVFIPPKHAFFHAVSKSFTPLSEVLFEGKQGWQALQERG